MRPAVAFGLIGWNQTAGEIASRLVDLPQAEVRWLCDPASELKLGPSARRIGARRTFDPDVLCKDEHLDAVIVCAPYEQRSDLIERALLAEKHVLVLGSVAGSRLAAERLLSLASQRGRVLEGTTAFLRDSAFLALEARLSAGQLGEPFYLAAESTVTEQIDLSELLAEDVAALLRLTRDRPAEVEADAIAYMDDNDPDVLACSFRFATGITARFSYSRVEAIGRRVLRLVGSRATAVLDRTARDCSLIIHERPRPEAEGHSLTLHLPRNDPYAVVCEDFLTSVCTGPVNGSSAEMVAVAETLEAVETSLALRQRGQRSTGLESYPPQRSKGDIRDVRIAHL